jgi:hypothetical protein
MNKRIQQILIDGMDIQSSSDDIIADILCSQSDGRFAVSLRKKNQICTYNQSTNQS